MPLDGFWTAVMALLILHIVHNGLLSGQSRRVLLKVCAPDRGARRRQLSIAVRTIQRGGRTRFCLLCARLKRAPAFFSYGLPGRDTGREAITRASGWGKAICNLLRLLWKDASKDICMREPLLPRLLHGRSLGRTRLGETSIEAKWQHHPASSPLRVC